MNTRTFVNKYGIRMDFNMVDSNPNWNNEDSWARSATHYKCTLKYKSKRLTTYYSMGSAICKDPRAEDLLDCLASDASSYENCKDFEDWCRDFGYDPDSRKAYQTFKACGANTAKLQKFLSADSDSDMAVTLFDELMLAERL